MRIKQINIILTTDGSVRVSNITIKNRSLEWESWLLRYLPVIALSPDHTSFFISWRVSCQYSTQPWTFYSCGFSQTGPWIHTLRDVVRGELCHCLRARSVRNVASNTNLTDVILVSTWQQLTWDSDLIPTHGWLQTFCNIIPQCLIFVTTKGGTLLQDIINIGMSLY